jgi:hypothetical protein
VPCESGSLEKVVTEGSRRLVPYKSLWFPVVQRVVPGQVWCVQRIRNLEVKASRVVSPTFRDSFCKASIVVVLVGFVFKLRNRKIFKVLGYKLWEHLSLVLLYVELNWCYCFEVC